MAKHNVTGSIGELVASEFLESKGHKILDKNFRRSYGELDLVSRERKGILHFVEVKAVSYETQDSKTIPSYPRPEENVHEKKAERLKKIIQVYLSFKNIRADWQFDVLAVFLDHTRKTARIRYLENVILE